ncbi:hypothetical protein BSNT_10706 [Bacillus subtilis subsp. natto BEST195]|nr:hypothetical protein BSNT_10706 [Bacillus subtilis subsp. natto BEST195]
MIHLHILLALLSLLPARFVKPLIFIIHTALVDE